MKRMILTKLTLSGVGKKDAVLTFERGLNVITGDSDTGIQYGHQYNYIQFNHEGNVRKGFIPSQEEYC